MAKNPQLHLPMVPHPSRDQYRRRDHSQPRLSIRRAGNHLRDLLGPGDPAPLHPAHLPGVIARALAAGIAETAGLASTSITFTTAIIQMIGLNPSLKLVSPLGLSSLRPLVDQHSHGHRNVYRDPLRLRELRAPRHQRLISRHTTSADLSADRCNSVFLRRAKQPSPNLGHHRVLPPYWHGSPALAGL
jgi:hypothetical protein